MSNFQNILTKPAAEVERPKPLPIGTYLCTLNDPATVTERSGFDVVGFQLTINAPQDDVDPDSLQEFGNVAGKKLSRDFLFSKDDPNAAAEAEYNLVRFISEHLGVEKGSKTLGELIAEAQGNQVLATIRWDPDKNDPERIYIRVKATAPVE